MKAHSKFGGDALAPALNNSRENNRVVVIRHIQLGKAMWKLLCIGRDKMEVTRVESGSGINNGTDLWAGFIVQICPQLKSNVGEFGHDGCREKFLVSSRGRKHRHVNNKNQRIMGPRPWSTHIGLLIRIVCDGRSSSILH
jgi:hypothetical protein